MKVFGFSYAVACTLYIMSSIEKFFPNDEHTDWTIEFEDKIGEESIKKYMIVTMYYALTTLSTVGFGDFYATTKAECLLSIVIFVGGVSVYGVF